MVAEDHQASVCAPVPVRLRASQAIGPIQTPITHSRGEPVEEIRSGATNYHQAGAVADASPVVASAWRLFQRAAPPPPPPDWDQELVPTRAFKRLSGDMLALTTRGAPFS